jgi:hypothetical protein
VAVEYVAGFGVDAAVDVDGFEASLWCKRQLQCSGWM